MQFFFTFYFCVSLKTPTASAFYDTKKFFTSDKKRAKFVIFALVFLFFSPSFGVALSHIAISFVRLIIYANKTS